MRLGVGLTQHHQPELARRVERIGFDSVWIGGHLLWHRPMLDPLPQLAAYAAVSGAPARRSASTSRRLDNFYTDQSDYQRDDLEPAATLSRPDRCEPIPIERADGRRGRADAARVPAVVRRPILVLGLLRADRVVDRAAGARAGALPAE